MIEIIEIVKDRDDTYRIKMNGISINVFSVSREEHKLPTILLKAANSIILRDKERYKVM